MAFLNKGLNLKVQDLRKEDGHSAEFNYSGGIVSFVELLNESRHPIHDKVIHFESQKDGVMAEVALQYSDTYSENSFFMAIACLN